MSKIFLFLIMFTSFIVGSMAKEITNEEMVKFFKNNRVGDSPDYAVVKNGNDVLMVITGMMDDKAVCEDMIRPYNEDPSLSDIPGQYACVKVND